MLNDENIYARIITGELSDEEIAQLKENGDWDAIKRVLDASSELEMPSLDRDKNLSKIYEQGKKIKKKSKLRRFYIMSSSIAAAITIIIIGAIFLLNPKTSLEAERGQNLEYVFSDKSEVFLNAQSKISFRENRWDKERQIDLDGEAYFKVIKGGPFTVKSKVGSVRVLGTEFNIKTHNGIYEVECFEGKVQVLYKDSKIVLEKDDAVYFDKDGKITQRQIPNNESDWLNGRSRFRDERLGMVLSELERQFNVRVTSNTNESVFTGVFDHTDLETAANQIAKPLGLEFVISEDKKSISFSQ